MRGRNRLFLTRVLCHSSKLPNTVKHRHTSMIDVPRKMARVRDPWLRQRGTGHPLLTRVHKASAGKGRLSAFEQASGTY